MLVEHESQNDDGFYAYIVHILSGKQGLLWEIEESSFVVGYQLGNTVEDIWYTQKL